MGLPSDQQTSAVQQQDDEELQTPSSSSSSASSPKRMGTSTSKPANSRKRSGQSFEVVVEVPRRTSTSGSNQRKSPSRQSEDADVTLSPTKKQRIAPASPLLPFPTSPTRNAISTAAFQPAPDSVENRVIHATNSLENLTTYTPDRNGQRTRSKSRDRSISPSPSFELPMPSGQPYNPTNLPSSSQLTSLSRQQWSSPGQGDSGDVKMASESEEDGDMTLDNIGQDDESSVPPSSAQVQCLNGKLVTVTSKPKASSGSRVGTAPSRGVGRPKKSPIRSSSDIKGTGNEVGQAEGTKAGAVGAMPASESSARRNIDAFMASRGVTSSSPPININGADAKAKQKARKPRKSAPKSQDVDESSIMSNYGERSKRSSKPSANYAVDNTSSSNEEEPARRPHKSDRSVKTAARGERSKGKSKESTEYASAGSDYDLEEAEENLAGRKAKNGKGKASNALELEAEREDTAVATSEFSEMEADPADRTARPKKRKSVLKGKASKVPARAKKEESTPELSDGDGYEMEEPLEAEEESSDGDSDDFTLKPSSSSKSKPASAKRKESKSKVGRPTKQQKPVSPAPVRKAPTLVRKPIRQPSHSGSEEDEKLPTLLPRSSFATLGSQPKWDLQLLDEAVFVALPGKRKEPSETETELSVANLAADVPRFWWPAKISSRNRQNFRVRVVVDARKEEILKYTSAEAVIPQEQLNEAGIVNLKDSITDELRFADIAAATASFVKHSLAAEYTHPSQYAFKAAVRKGRQVLEDESSSSDEESKTSPQKKKPVKKSKTKGAKKSNNASPEHNGIESTTQQLVDGMWKSSQTQVESDSEEEELDPEIEVGTCGLGQSDIRKNEWWPAKVIEIRSMEEVQREISTKNSSQNRKRPGKTTKNGPYNVEFYPGESNSRRSEYWIWREHFLTSTDKGFKQVPLGKMEERKLNDDDITSEELESIREPLKRLMKDAYQPGTERMELFFGTRAQRAQLPSLVRYGDFTVSHIKQVSDYIQAMLDSPDNDASPRIAECTQEERITLIASALLPVALEILVIHDDNLMETASACLAEQELPADRQSAELRAHELAADILDNKKDWYKTVLAFREVSNGANSIKEGIKIDRKEISGFADSGSRAKKRMNYKE